jgi:hypothetical protein
MGQPKGQDLGVPAQKGVHLPAKDSSALPVDDEDFPKPRLMCCPKIVVQEILHIRGPKGVQVQ